MGLVSKSENSDELKKNIIQITKYNARMLKRINKNCINFYKDSFSIDMQVTKIINILNNGWKNNNFRS